MKKIKVVFDCLDRTGFIYREEMIFDDIEDVVNEIVCVKHARGFTISDSQKGYIREFWKWNRTDRLCNWGFYNCRITIDYVE